MDQQVWKPITQLSRAELNFASSELRQVAQRWEVMQEKPFARAFLDRLQLEWSIDTGLIERIYSWDRGVTELLLEHGLKLELIPESNGLTRQQTKSMIEDHRAVLAALFDFIKQNRPLSTSYINELHVELLKGQECHDAIDSLGRVVSVSLNKGKYKRLPNNPRRTDGSMAVYCPPDHTASEMQNLIEMFRQQDDPITFGGAPVPPDVRAAWLHHRFTQIHPFEDGNGRVARALATLVLIKEKLFPFNIPDIPEWKKPYIEALEMADQGSLRPLIRLLGRLQLRMFYLALHAEIRESSPNPDLPLRDAVSQAVRAVAAIDSVDAWRHLNPKKLAEAALKKVATGISQLTFSLNRTEYFANAGVLMELSPRPLPHFLVNDLTYTPVEVTDQGVTLTFSKPIPYFLSAHIHSVGSLEHGTLSCVIFAGTPDRPALIGDPLFLFGDVEWNESELTIDPWLESTLSLAIQTWRVEVTQQNKTGSPLEPPASS